MGPSSLPPWWHEHPLARQRSTPDVTGVARSEADEAVEANGGLAKPGHNGPMTWPRVGIALVRGRSMEPTLHEGDRLLVVYGVRPVRGRLAIVRLPDGDGGPRPVGVKRVTRRAPGGAGWWVERDNPCEGVDSWSAGAVPEAGVLGLVVARLPRPFARFATRPPV